MKKKSSQNKLRKKVGRLAARIKPKVLAKQLKLPEKKIRQWAKQVGNKAGKGLTREAAKRELALLVARQEFAELKLRIQKLQRGKKSKKAGSAGEKAKRKNAKRGKNKAPGKKSGINNNLQRRIASVAVKSGLETVVLGEKLHVKPERIEKWKVKFGAKPKKTLWPQQRTEIVIKQLSKRLRGSKKPRPSKPEAVPQTPAA